VGLELESRLGPPDEAVPAVAYIKELAKRGVKIVGI
jgi:hypothetical protein